MTRGLGDREPASQPLGVLGSRNWTPKAATGATRRVTINTSSGLKEARASAMARGERARQGRRRWCLNSVSELKHTYETRRPGVR